MGRIRRFFYYIAALDPTLTTDQRLARWADIVALAGVPVTLITGAVGLWVLNNPWVGVVVGLGIWNLALSGLVALRRLRSSGSPEASAGEQPESVTAQPVPDDADPRHTQELETYR